MSRVMGSALSAALDDPVIEPVLLLFLDFQGDPLRVITWVYSVAPTGSGDSLIDGYTFAGIGAQNPLVRIGDIGDSATGSDAVELSLSVPIDQSAAIENVIGDKARWQGRRGCLWYSQMNGSRALIDAPVRLKWGRMANASFLCEPESQILTLALESHQNNVAVARRRHGLQNAQIDPLDESPKAKIALANGSSGVGLGGSGSRLPDYPGRRLL